MKFADRVRETTTTTGTGSVTLAGALAQFEAFQTNFATSEVLFYAIVGQGTGEWEVGIGSLSGATTLARTTVLQSSNSDALVNFSAGTKDVFVPIPSGQMNRLWTKGQLTAALAGAAMP